MAADKRGRTQIGVQAGERSALLPQLFFFVRYFLIRVTRVHPRPLSSEFPVSGKTFGWLEVDRIAEELADAHPDIDPIAIKFVDLRAIVERLPNFAPDTAHPVNERILEAIQMSWLGEKHDRDD
jgi:FeS assembly protein IscX